MARRGNSGRRKAPLRPNYPRSIPGIPGLEKEALEEEWDSMSVEEKEAYIASNSIFSDGVGEEDTSPPMLRAPPGDDEGLALPYITAGLPEVFALAIAKNIDNGEKILDLYEAKWWKQYDVDDPLILSVLDGKFTSDEAEYINSFRSDHVNLANACIEGLVTLEWARSLIDSGFNGNMEAVNACLEGGEPRLIARIMKIEGDYEKFPPALSIGIVKKLNERLWKKLLREEGMEKMREEVEMIDERMRKESRNRKARERRQAKKTAERRCPTCNHPHNYEWLMCDACGYLNGSHI